MKVYCPACHESWDIPLSECAFDEDGNPGFGDVEVTYCSEPGCQEILAMEGCCEAPKCEACGEPYCKEHMPNGKVCVNDLEGVEAAQ